MRGPARRPSADSIGDGVRSRRGGAAPAWPRASRSRTWCGRATSPASRPTTTPRPDDGRPGADRPRGGVRRVGRDGWAARRVHRHEPGRGRVAQRGRGDLHRPGGRGRHRRPTGCWSCPAPATSRTPRPRCRRRSGRRCPRPPVPATCPWPPSAASSIARRLGEPGAEALEDEGVERDQAVPVEAAGQPTRVEQGPLAQSRSCALGLDGPLQPGVARREHLGPQPQERCGGSRASTRQKSRASPTWRSSGWRRPRRMPTPPRSTSIDPRIDQSGSATYQPRAPPMPATVWNSCSGEACDHAVLLVGQQRAAGPVGIGGHRIGRCAPGQGRHPTSGRGPSGRRPAAPPPRGPRGARGARGA